MKIEIDIKKLGKYFSTFKGRELLEQTCSLVEKLEVQYLNNMIDEKTYKQFINSCEFHNEVGQTQIFLKL